ncbi:hypothetical protein BH24ACI5_BH24ACI5_23100 [soil metagenome]
MERVLQLLCEREKAHVDTRVLVANTRPETVHEIVDGVPVTRAGRRGSAGSVTLCPSFPALLERERADVIVLHEPNPLGLLAYALARPKGRLVIWFHAEVVRSSWQYTLIYRPWFAFAMRRASRIIVASPPMAQAAQLQGFGVPTTVIPYGVDERRLEPTPDVVSRAAELRRRHPGPLALFVGRMVPYKGLDVLLRAMTKVNATAVLVGSGPQRAGLEALAATLGVASKVVFAGETEPDDLLAWYQACDMFVLPSTTRAEAFAVVQTEAMAFGKPVVSTNLPTGVPWVNRDDETGLVVAPGDADALADALTRLAADPELRRRLGEGGRRRVREEFTADRMAIRAVEVYRDVAAMDGHRATAIGQSVDAMLAAIVRGDAVAPPAAGDSGAAFLEAATRHGVRALAAERLGPRLADWPAPVQAALGREAVLGAALEALQERELKQVLELLAARGVSPLLLKGSALAHTVYASPAQRPRFDTDLLVRREEMDAVTEVMTGRGYTRPNLVSGELVMHQVDFARKDSHGVWHVYDFHWKVANRQAVAGVLSFDELARDAEPIPALGPHARGLSRVHALLLACVHRLAHHPTEDRLIWIHDIHLLTETLSPSDAESFGTLALDRSVSALCADGLTAAGRWFGTRVPAGLLDRLTAPPRSGAPEPSAAFLEPHVGRIDELLSDLRALSGWSRRVRLVREHAFPPPAYIAGMYSVSNRALLPALYTHRIVRGAWRWLRRGSR